ncbi:MAG: glutamate--tRNA ligase [Deltaproteobacteria bacterium RBG_16_54_11]|jgi:nondiscriminating glutamyl-tRNA synthetase|nr:MAG: glutamate--tRNA ligase [Deltaproteobacteria bacterium RBG_16_54_11]
MKQGVRVRFAPSPTGLLHIGNARTALYNKLFALQHNGVFILRIEDTDVARRDPAAEAAIMEDLRWMGLSWDEGPAAGGGHGPYRQSERTKIYQEYAQRLLREERVYPCFCTPEELAEMREQLLAGGQTPRYGGRCRGLSPQQVKELEREGRKPSLRFKVPDGVTVIRDIIHGKKVFENKTIGDFVIMRSDGSPAYNFAAVVDDASMGITHIIRGEDHLPNTPRQIILYEALGSIPPSFAHHPLLVASDGERLSKRHGAVSVRAYREQGFLPEAVANYLALLGGGFPAGDEIIALAEMVRRFSLERIARSPAAFDLGKLRWLNRGHLRAMRGEEILPHARPFLQDLPLEGVTEKWLVQILDAIKENVETLAELRGNISIFLPGEFSMDDEARSVLAVDGALAAIKAMEEVVEGMEEINEGDFPGIVAALKERTGLKGKELFAPIRAALTGRAEGPELKKVLPLLGKRVILERLAQALK